MRTVGQGRLNVTATGRRRAQVLEPADARERPGRSASSTSARPIVTAPPTTTAGTAPSSAAASARLERAELVRGADEHHLDREHASAQLVRRDDARRSSRGCSC